MSRTAAIAFSLSLLTACVDSAAPLPDDDVGSSTFELSDPAARRTRSAAIRDAAADKGLTNGVLLAGIAQVETGLSHCWSEATWACQGPTSASCGGPVIAGAADGPCSAEQGGLGMFQFDGGTYAQTLARDGSEILELDGNIRHAVDFVAERVRQEVAGVSTAAEAITWLNGINPQAGDPKFEEWIEIVSCRYNGCCGCSSQETKYRNATLDAVNEFEPGFWGQISEPPSCEPIPNVGAVIDDDDPCADAGGPASSWRTEIAGYQDRLMWTYTTDDADAVNFAQWNMTFTDGGRYKLEVHTDGGQFAQSQLATYRVTHAAGEVAVTIDQAATYGWQELGTFDFDALAAYQVRFDDNTGEPLSGQTRIAFDALRITPIDPDDPTDPNDPIDPNDPADPNDPGEPGPDDIGGGCSTGGTAPGALWLVAGVLFALRRRR